MKQCESCKTAVPEGHEADCSTSFLCEDCYIDVLCQGSRRASYNECSHSFMLRLKPGFDNQRLSAQGVVADNFKN